MRMRRKRVRVLLVIGLVLAGILASAGIATALEVGDRAPDFRLPSTTGEEISLGQFRGKKLVLIEFHINDFGVT